VAAAFCAHENQEKALHHFGHHAALSYEASQVFLVLLQSQHENMKANGHDDQTSLRELYESLRYLSFPYAALFMSVLFCLLIFQSLWNVAAAFCAHENQEKALLGI
jgi:hypothetical protein